MEKLSFKVAEVEGPLDLILQLISKHKLNIQDIEITELLKQYLAAIEEMQQDMEISSEFLEMAARLVYIKSCSLLPRYEEAEALKQELTGQLLEYKICKEIAKKLGETNFMGDIFIKQPDKIDFDMTYKRTHESEDILNAYLSVVGKAKRKLPPPKEAFSGIISHRVVSVRSRIIKILHTLYKNSKVDLEHLYEGAEDKSELVATFLAVLELVKDRRVSVSQENDVKLTNQFNEALHFNFTKTQTDEIDFSEYLSYLDEEEKPILGDVSEKSEVQSNK